MVLKDRQTVTSFYHNARVWQTDGRADRQTDVDSKSSHRHVDARALKMIPVYDYRVRVENMVIKLLRLQVCQILSCLITLSLNFTVISSEKRGRTTANLDRT